MLTLANSSKSAKSFFALLCNLLNSFALDFQLKQLDYICDANRQELVCPQSCLQFEQGGELVNLS